MLILLAVFHDEMRLRRPCSSAPSRPRLSIRWRSVPFIVEGVRYFELATRKCPHSSGRSRHVWRVTTSTSPFARTARPIPIALSLSKARSTPKRFCHEIIERPTRPRQLIHVAEEHRPADPQSPSMATKPARPCDVPQSRSTLGHEIRSSEPPGSR
jgi:hypothetical protein